MRWKRSDTIILTILVSIYILAAVIRPDTWIYDQISKTSQFWRDITQNTSSAVASTFLVTLIGNSSWFIGVIPYPIIVFDIAKYYSDWWILAIFGGLGAGIGDFTATIIGSLIGKSKSKSVTTVKRNFTSMQKRLDKNPKRMPFFVFLFAMTPLPDDMILMPLGMMKYSWKDRFFKGLLPCILGKTILMFLIVYLGHEVGSNAEYLNELIYNYPILFFLRLVVPTEEINPSYDIIQFSLIIWIFWIMLNINIQDADPQKNPLLKSVMKIDEISNIYKQCPHIINDKKYNKCIRGNNSVKGFEKCYNKYIYKKKKCDVKYHSPRKK